MSTSGVSLSAISALFQQRRLDFKTLTSAIDAGDTTAAQDALKSYQNDNNAIGAAGGSSQTKTGGSFGVKIKTDLSNLTSAVQSGNITDAQAALKTFRQDRQALRQDSASTDPNSTTSSSLSDDLTKLITAIKSGDASGEQTSADALAKDLLAAVQSGGTDKAHGHHGHHHHHDGGVAASGDGSVTPSPVASADVSTTSSTDTSASTSTSNSGDPTSRLAAVLKQFFETFLDANQTTQTTTQIAL